MAELAPPTSAQPRSDLATRLSRKAEALRDAHPGEPAALEVAALLVEAEQAIAQRAAQAPLTDEQIEQGRRETFSTDNPFCPCTDKTMRKAVRWAERACAAAWGVNLGAKAS